MATRGLSKQTVAWRGRAPVDLWSTGARVATVGIVAMRSGAWGTSSLARTLFPQRASSNHLDAEMFEVADRVTRRSRIGALHERSLRALCISPTMVDGLW